MDIIDNLIIPSSGNILTLLNYLLILALVIYSVYLGVLLTSSLISIIFKIIYYRKQNIKYLVLSKDYIELITPNKTMAVGLGVVPFLSIILIYIQFLRKSNSDIIIFLSLSFFLFVISAVLLYLYKFTLKTTSVVQSKIIKSGFMNWLYGIIGFLLLLISTRLFTTLINFASDSSNWQSGISIFTILFTTQSILRMVQFMTISYTLTALAFIVKYFYWDKPEEQVTSDYPEQARKINEWLAIGFAFLQPLLLLFDYWTIPKEIMSARGFLYGIFALLCLLLMLHLLYTAIRWKKHGSLLYSFSLYLIILTFTFLIIKEQSAFALSSQQQVLQITDNYEKLETERLEKEGKLVNKIDGAEIYKTKCLACHKFDEKLVGPPHKEVMLKYLNNKDGMVKFILNPVKVDPAYPEMPNQGLKPKEAEAIVEYMYKEYGDKLK